MVRKNARSDHDAPLVRSTPPIAPDPNHPGSEVFLRGHRGNATPGQKRSNRHPGLLALADFLTGNCSPGTALLVSRHIAICRQCRSQVERHAGPWEWLAEGVEVAYLSAAFCGLGEIVCEIRLAAGAHVHMEASLCVVEVLVLDGGYRQNGEVFSAGDFQSADGRAWAVVADQEAGFSGLLTA